MLQVMKNAIFLIFSGDINCNGHQKGIFFFDWRQSLYAPVYDWGSDRSKNGFDFRFTSNPQLSSSASFLRLNVLSSLN